MSETHLNIIGRLEAEANFCNKNPKNCSIRTFDILEDARGRIEELVVENKRLKAMYDAATGDREDALRSCDKVTDLLFETQVENERLIEENRSQAVIIDTQIKVERGLREMNDKLTTDLLRIDIYCRNENIDIDQALKGQQ